MSLRDKPDISLDAFLDKWKKGEAILLDVRTREKTNFLIDWERFPEINWYVLFVLLKLEM